MQTSVRPTTWTRSAPRKALMRPSFSRKSIKSANERLAIYFSYGRAFPLHAAFASFNLHISSNAVAIETAFVARCLRRPFPRFRRFFVNCSFAGLKSHAFSLPSSKPQTCHHTNQKGGRKPDLAAGLLHDHLSHTAGNGTCANAKHLQLDVDETSAHSASFCIALRKRLCLQEWVCGCPGLLQAGQRHPDSASGCRKCVRDGPVKLI